MFACFEWQVAIQADHVDSVAPLYSNRITRQTKETRNIGD